MELGVNKRNTQGGVLLPATCVQGRDLWSYSTKPHANARQCWAAVHRKAQEKRMESIREGRLALSLRFGSSCGKTLPRNSSNLFVSSSHTVPHWISFALCWQNSSIGRANSLLLKQDQTQALDLMGVNTCALSRAC